MTFSAQISALTLSTSSDLDATLDLPLTQILDTTDLFALSSFAIADGDEGGEVFGEAGTTVTDTSIEKLAADAFVHADALGNLFDIGSRFFTDCGDRIDV